MLSHLQTWEKESVFQSNSILSLFTVTYLLVGKPTAILALEHKVALIDWLFSIKESHQHQFLNLLTERK